MSTVRFLGTTDEVDVCDCCGRTGLKSTVALSIDDGDAVYYGVTCAARALAMPVKAIRAGTAAADRAKEQAKLAAEQAIRTSRHVVELAAWDAYLASAAPAGITERFARIEALGGWARANAAYKAAQAAA